MRTIQDILKKDPEFGEEIKKILESGDNLPIAKRNGISKSDVLRAMVGPVNELPRAEAMIRLHLRPALLIRKNRIEPPDSVELGKRLLPCISKIESRIPSVGRIDFRKLGRPFGGTGWMISEDTIITNRHVASLFAEKKGKTLAFKRNAMGEIIEVFIDFKEEYSGPGMASPEFEVPVEKVLFIANEVPSQPDIAFLKIKRHPKNPAPIPVSDKDPAKDLFVSVIGYPAYDPGGIISSSAAAEVFKNIYEVKRCSPGEIMSFEKGSWYFFHDCTTLGGNSGSVVLDNETGIAVGLHFMGEVEKENYAVKGSEIIKYLHKINKKVHHIKGPSPKPKEEIDEKMLEAPPESFNDRKGYNESFLGKNFKVALPKITKKANEVLKFKQNGKLAGELKYHHFSVIMNKDRRMCFFSACNIDGKLSKRGVKRSTWRYDSRIPKESQLLKECYGNPPRFARGHMTRKEDPIWGEMQMAKAAANDTFHVTNATPQMQPFNAPVWLELEDYALENARQDDMKITVITGPIFRNDDPVKYGVKIPTAFFKVIAFIHDDTGKLCATGYTVSQEDYLRNEEFVFGQFNTYQISIKSIEKKTGIDFGKLATVDPIKGEEAIASALSDVTDIRFI